MSAQSVLFDAPGPKARRRHSVVTLIALVVAVAALAFVVLKFQQSGQLEPSMWARLFEKDIWTEYLIPGLINTIKAALAAIVAAMVFGIIFGMGRLSRSKWISWPSGIIVEFFRAVPVLLMMYFLFSYFGRNNTFGSDWNGFVAVVIALTLYNGSVIAELVRSGVYGLPNGQAEAGLSIGLTAGQTLRSIQLPQALTAMLPALVGQLVVVLKDTALGSALPYVELLAQAKNVGSAYANTIPAYILAAVLFILMNYGLTVLANRVQRRLARRGLGKSSGSEVVGSAAAAPLPGSTAADERGH